MTIAQNIAISATSFCKSAELRDLACRELHPHHVTFGNPAVMPTAADLVQLFRDCVGAIVGREPITASLLAKTPSLKAIAKYGVGTDNIDFDACERFGVDVLLAPGVNAQAVAEHTIGLALALLRNIGPTFASLKAGVWDKDGGTQLSGKRVAIVGAGAIGSRVARLFKAFDCDILIVDIVDKSDLARSLNASLTSFDDAMRTADIVSLHVPLTPLTNRMVNKSTLRLMRPSAFLINTSRGEVIDQTDLIAALSTRQIAGAGLDVFEVEPIIEGAFWSLPGLVGTPHIAGNAREAVRAMGKAAVNNLKRWINRTPSL